jgi:hypothetical protein
MSVATEGIRYDQDYSLLSKFENSRCINVINVDVADGLGGYDAISIVSGIT